MVGKRATLSVKEVAACLGIGERSACAMLRNGVIPNLRWGRKFIIAKPEFEAWLAACSKSKKAVN